MAYEHAKNVYYLKPPARGTRGKSLKDTLTEWNAKKAQSKEWLDKHKGSSQIVRAMINEAKRKAQLRKN